MTKPSTILIVQQTLIRASTRFSDDKKAALRQAIATESNPNAKWVLEQTLENAEIAEKTQHPTCDDTGIPHILLKVGGTKSVSAEVEE